MPFFIYLPQLLPTTVNYYRPLLTTIGVYLELKLLLLFFNIRFCEEKRVGGIGGIAYIEYF